MPTILITGITGFIGSHVAAALAGRGHQVIGTVRLHHKDGNEADSYRLIPVDYIHDFDVNIWKPRLEGVDVVVNAVGILRQHGQQTFEALHYRAPRALFAACAAKGIKVVQMSALGADENARSRYHLSKKMADDALLASGNRAVIVQPSLVYGTGGVSARLFNLIAALPIIPLPGQGNQEIQPIHIDDLTCAVTELVETDRYLGQRVPLVGPEALTLQRYLSELRSLMGLGRGIFVQTPIFWVNIAAQLGQRLGKGLLDVESWQMLQRGNTADPVQHGNFSGTSPDPSTSSYPLGISGNHGWQRFSDGCSLYCACPLLPCG